MSNVIFGNNNLIDNANISLLSGTANSQFPIANIKHPFSTKVFRSSSTSCSILIDTLGANNVNLIALRGSNLESLGFNSVTFQGSATTTFSGSDTTIDMSIEHNFAFKEISTTNLRYWRLTFTGTTYVEISNIFLGEKVQMSDNNLSLGWSYTLNTNSKVTKNTFGQKFIDQYGTSKILSGDIKYANTTEFAQLQDIQLAHGENSPIWFILDSSDSIGIIDSKYMFSGMFFMKDLTWKNVAPGLFDVQLNLEEAV